MPNTRNRKKRNANRNAGASGSASTSASSSASTSASTSASSSASTSTSSLEQPSTSKASKPAPQCTCEPTCSGLADPGPSSSNCELHRNSPDAELEFYEHLERIRDAEYEEKTNTHEKRMEYFRKEMLEYLQETEWMYEPIERYINF